MLTAMVTVIIQVRYLWREKLVSWKFYTLKHFARVVRAGYTLLMRHAEIVGRNKHLNIAFYLNNCKNTYGNQNIFRRLRAELTAKHVNNTLRYSAAW